MKCKPEEIKNIMPEEWQDLTIRETDLGHMSATDLLYALDAGAWLELDGGVILWTAFTPVDPSGVRPNDYLEIDDEVSAAGQGPLTSPSDEDLDIDLEIEALTEELMEVGS